MATFSQRIRAAVEFEDEVERFLERHDDIRIVSRNGTEHIHPQVVAKYPPEKRFPIADGWIHPRLAENHCDLIVGSGTPFRQIDIELCDRLMDLDKWEQTTRAAISEAT